MATALLLPLILGHSAGPEGDRFVTGMALLLTAVIVTTSSIANDNLQDLKTGQVLGATPWHQQVALILGVGMGAVVIAPLLSLLYEAYGFVGAPARDGQDAGSAMPAPQAALMTQIANGIIAQRTALEHGADRGRARAWCWWPRSVAEAARPHLPGADGRYRHVPAALRGDDHRHWRHPRLGRRAQAARPGRSHGR